MHTNTYIEHNCTLNGWIGFTVHVRYHIEGSMKLNAHILHLAHMVYL
jgi:hypothetical protein